MAKKGNRVQVILECTEHKDSGKPGTSRYISTKNKKNSPERLELKKFNPKFTSDVLSIFELKNSVNSKKSFGGTSFSNIKKMIVKYKKNL